MAAKDFLQAAVQARIQTTRELPPDCRHHEFDIQVAVNSAEYLSLRLKHRFMQFVLGQVLIRPPLFVGAEL